MDEIERKQRLAYAIRAAMNFRDMSPPQVAVVIGRDANTVRRWAEGRTAPSALDLGPLAEALGVRPQFLLDPPPIPDYPLVEFLVEQTARQATREGLRRGVRRARDRKG